MYQLKHCYEQGHSSERLMKSSQSLEEPNHRHTMMVQESVIKKDASHHPVYIEKITPPTVLQQVSQFIANLVQ